MRTLVVLSAIAFSACRGDEAVRKLLARALAMDLRIESLVPKRETLEDIFVRKAF